MTLTTRTISAPVVPSRGALRPLGVDEVQITGGFWGERQATNGSSTLPHIEHWLEREGWLGNFDLAAAGTLPEGRRGREFSDSEIYKYLEALAWEIGRRASASGGAAGSVDVAHLESRFREIVDRVAAAQEPDGYLNTQFGRPGQGARWSDLEWGHELYCLGHLFQAAVARERTSPGSDDGLLGIAVRAADLVCEVFGERGIPSVCGHPEVEVGLAELGRVTGDPRYLEQAALFVERRGHGVLNDIEWGRSYFQDDVPVREAVVLRGHAVRANYLAAGAVDVAVETGDSELTTTLREQWHNTVARRTYVTGGQGSHHQDEAFGADWELPSDRAYSETCAGIASIMFSWRLLLDSNDPRYADLIERTLFNVVATSPSATGTAFFYANTLHQRTPGKASPTAQVSPRASSSVRAPWFEVSCCPPNVARTLSSLAGYVATVNNDGLQIHQFAPATIATTLPDGRPLTVDVETDYPRTGTISVRVVEAPEGRVALTLRVPAWADSARLSVLPAIRDAAESSVEHRDAAPGYVTIRREFAPGDTVELTLPVQPRVTYPDPRIDAIRGSVAIERGPEVYCLESLDVPGDADAFSRIEIDLTTAPVDDADGVTVRLRHRQVDDASLPYSADFPGGGEPFAGRLIPYNSWAERGPSTMRVWIPTAT